MTNKQLQWPVSFSLSIATIRRNLFRSRLADDPPRGVQNRYLVSGHITHIWRAKVAGAVTFCHILTTSIDVAFGFLFIERNSQSLSILSWYQECWKSVSPMFLFYSPPWPLFSLARATSSLRDFNVYVASHASLYAMGAVSEKSTYTIEMRIWPLLPFLHCYLLSLSYVPHATLTRLSKSNKKPCHRWHGETLNSSSLERMLV